jgi:chromodomain-helicase-DNA-binding protein 4
MASQDHVSDSEASEVDLLQTPIRTDNAREPSQPESVLSYRFRGSPPKRSDSPAREKTSMTKEGKIAVMISPPSRPWEYQPFRGDTTVDNVLEEFETADGQVWYKIEFEDGRKQDVSSSFT